MALPLATTLAVFPLLFATMTASAKPASTPTELPCDENDKEVEYSDVHLVADGDTALDTSVLLFRLCRALSLDPDFAGTYRRVLLYGDASAIASLYGQRGNNTLSKADEETSNLAFWISSAA